MSTRDLNHSSIIVGRKGTGKSTMLAEIATRYKGKVLILDVNGSPAYNKFPQITINDIKRKLKSGKVRLLGTPDEESLKIISDNYRDGLVVFEDCTKYIYGHVRPEIRTFLVDHRMFNCDLIFTFHNLNRVPPFFWEMISYLTLLKTQGTLDPSQYKNRIPNFDKVASAFKRVTDNKSNYYSETIETLI